MWHLLTDHQQESTLPFSSRKSLSCLSRVAKRSTPKPHGPLLFTPSEPHGPLSSLHQSCMTLSFLPPKLVVLSLLWLPRLGLNPSAHLPLQPHFQLLSQSVTPTSILVFFQLYWAAIVSPGRQGPKKGFVNGVQDSGCPGNIGKMYIGCPHPHRPEPGGMGHMEQDHSELFCIATAMQLTSGI